MRNVCHVSGTRVLDCIFNPTFSETRKADLCLRTVSHVLLTFLRLPFMTSIIAFSHGIFLSSMDLKIIILTSLPDNDLNPSRQ